ncbi:MAG TPA: electron transfer flavoprotein subunit alpha/FixB family protein [Terracidiphilus sp.]
MSGILIIEEARKGGGARAFQETLTAARILADLIGQPIQAAGIGDSEKNLFLQVCGVPPTAAYEIVHPLLETYTSDGYTLAYEQIIRQLEPDYVIFPHTYQSRDFVPCLAARFGQSLIGDVTAIEQGPVFVRQLFQGKFAGQYSHQGNGPCFISIQMGAFRPESTGGGIMPIHRFTPTLDAAQIRTKPGAPYRASAQTVDLSSAQRIVSVGRGIKDADKLPLVQELAAALGAELAASRPICDAGWLPMERQVGSSGQTVAPKLYVAVGISGAIQHLVGMKGSQCVVAINKDANAPIFEVADYGIVGDLFEVVPALTAAVKAATS